MKLAWRWVAMGFVMMMAGGLRAEEAARAQVWPGEKWETATPAEAGMDAAKLAEARDYALTGDGSGYITRHGRLVMAWGDPKQRYDLKSSTKSFGSIALGVAIKDGKIRLEEKAKQYHPMLGMEPKPTTQTAWIDEITILNLASQTAGFEKKGGTNALLFAPGTHWFYSDSGPNWLAECITLAYRRDLDEFMFERVFTPIGITREDLVWRKNAYRAKEIEGLMRREFGAGISANVNALARIGYMMLREGQWNGKEILTKEYARMSPRVPAGHEKLPTWATDPHGATAPHYGLLWWNNQDGTLAGVPRDAYWSWGLYDSFIFVCPSLDIVVGRAGKSWKRQEGAGHYEVLKPFFGKIVEAAEKK